MKIKDPYLHWG